MGSKYFICVNKIYLGLKVICEIFIYMIVFFYENYVYVYYVKYVVIVRV